MPKITLTRFLVFLSVILMVALTLQQCWQRKSDAEKWLYLFERPAREYAGRVLGPDRDTGLQPPEPLKQMMVEVHGKEGYVVFTSAMFSANGRPLLHMAFATDGPPPDPGDKPDLHWVPVRDSWYQLRAAP